MISTLIILIYAWPLQSSPKSEPYFYSKRFNSDIYCLAFSYNNNLLAIGDAYGEIHLLDLQTKELSILKYHRLSVNSIAFNPKYNQLLASASFDKTIAIWDVNKKQMLGKPIVEHISHVESIVFYPNGDILASCGADKYIHFWEFGLDKWKNRAEEIKQK